MAFTKKTWTKGEIIKATDLNHMEDGIEEASQTGGASELADLTDVELTSTLEDGMSQVLFFNTNNSKWANEAGRYMPFGFILYMYDEESERNCLVLFEQTQPLFTNPIGAVIADDILYGRTSPFIGIESENAFYAITKLHTDETTGMITKIETTSADATFIYDSESDRFVMQLPYEIKELTSSNRTYLMAAFDDISDLPTPTPYELQAQGYYLNTASTTIAGLRMDGGVSPSINGAILKVDGGSTVDFNPGALDISYAMCEFNANMNQPIGGASPSTWLTENRTLKDTTAYIGIHFKVNNGEMTEAIRNQLLSTIEIVAK